MALQWIPLVLKGVKLTILIENAAKILKAAIKLVDEVRNPETHKEKSGASKSEVSELRTDVDRLLQNEKQQAELVKDIANQLAAITQGLAVLRYMVATSLLVSIAAIVLAIIVLVITL